MEWDFNLGPLCIQCHKASDETKAEHQQHELYSVAKKWRSGSLVHQPLLHCWGLRIHRCRATGMRGRDVPISGKNIHRSSGKGAT